MEGNVAQDEGVIDLQLGKKTEHKYEWQMAVNGINAQPAITEYKVLGRREGYTWLELRLQTEELTSYAFIVQLLAIRLWEIRYTEKVTVKCPCISMPNHS